MDPSSGGEPAAAAVTASAVQPEAVDDACSVIANDVNVETGAE